MWAKNVHSFTRKRMVYSFYTFPNRLTSENDVQRNISASPRSQIRRFPRRTLYKDDDDAIRQLSGDMESLTVATGNKQDPSLELINDVIRKLKNGKSD